MKIQKHTPPDWAIQTKADEKAISLGYFWNEDLANKVINFISRYCYQSKGGWSGPVELQNFQIQLLKRFYSWYSPDGKPRFTDLLAYGPRKWGKSFIFGSALAAFHLLMEKRGEILVLASTVEQAKIIYDTICAFDQHPTIKARLHAKDHKNQIIDKVTKSKLKIVSSTNVQGTSGHNTSLMVLDEFCEWRSSIAESIYGRLKNSDMARKGGGGRKIIISTPQDDLSHVGKRLWDYAKSIIDGKVVDDLATMAVVYGADADDPPGDPETWKKAQPALGSIVPIEAYEKDWNQSKDSPIELARFRTLLLGQFVGSLKQYLNLDLFKKCYTPIPESDFYGSDGIIGLDMGGRYDLLSWVITLEKDGLIYSYPRFALPEGVLEKKSKSENKNYAAWLQAGYLKTCRGDVIDYDWVRDEIQDDLNQFNIKAFCMDDYKIESLRQWLETDKYIDCILINTNQYNQIDPLVRQYEALIKANQIRFPENPLLEWNCENLTCKMNDAQFLKPDKQKGSGKIDGIVATMVSLLGLDILREKSDFCGVV